MPLQGAAAKSAMIQQGGLADPASSTRPSNPPNGPRRRVLPDSSWSCLRLLAAYTTPQPWPAGTPLPAGARLFNDQEAARLHQSRAFLLRLDTLARLPLTKTWFPDIDESNAGVIAIAPASLRAGRTRIATNLARRRRDLLDMRGL